jgi:hypothetical protein
MSQNFLHIQKEYLCQVWSRRPEELEAALPARRQGDCFHFQAFGEPCELYREEIILGRRRLTGPEGILIALYAKRTLSHFFNSILIFKICKLTFILARKDFAKIDTVKITLRI